MSTNSMRDALRNAGVDVPDQPERRDDMTSRRQGGQGNRGNRSSGGRPQSGGNRPSGGPLPEMPKFPDAYFLSDEEGNLCLDPAFVSKKNVDPLAMRLANANPNLTTGQLRRFFNHCRKIERRMKVEGESWQQVAARFESLSSHAQNAAARPAKIPREFQAFIDSNIKRVNAEDDKAKAFQEGFLPHFEALVGFGSEHLKTN